MTTAVEGGGGNSGAMPSQDANQSSGNYASYVPHDLKYSSTFEDSLMQALLNANDKEHDGIRVIPQDSDEQAVEGKSVRIEDINMSNLPVISEDELPLPLSDPRRIFQSAIPGVKLTHPGGYLEGGPGLEPEMDTFPDDFLSNHPNVQTPTQLNKAVKKEVEASMEMLKERLRARQKAKEKNEQIEKELKTLTDQHSMELRIHNRMQEERREKREAKERKKREREGGGGGAAAS